NIKTMRQKRASSTGDHLLQIDVKFSIGINVKLPNLRFTQRECRPFQSMACGTRGDIRALPRHFEVTLFYPRFFKVLCYDLQFYCLVGVVRTRVSHGSPIKEES